MDAQVGQPLQRVGQFARGERAAFVPVGNITVLAINAAEGTAGKKDGACAADTGDRRLLPQVRRGAGDEHLLTQAAEARPDGPVNTATAGA